MNSYLEWTTNRLSYGALEVREENVKKALNANKSLKVIVTAECNDYMILTTEMLSHPESIETKMASGKWKEDYTLYKYSWFPFQEIGVELIRKIKKDGNTRGKQNRSKL